MESIALHQKKKQQCLFHLLQTPTQTPHLHVQFLYNSKRTQHEGHHVTALRVCGTMLFATTPLAGMFFFGHDHMRVVLQDVLGNTNIKMERNMLREYEKTRRVCHQVTW